MAYNRGLGLPTGLEEALLDAVANGDDSSGWSPERVEELLAWAQHVIVSELKLQRVVEGKLRIDGFRDGEPMFRAVPPPLRLVPRE
jgi:hypothetical protein